MAINFTQQASDKVRFESTAASSQTIRPETPPRASCIAIRSLSERQSPLLKSKAMLNPRGAIATNGPGDRTLGNAGQEPPDFSCPDSPLSTTLIRKIDRLTGDDERKSKRSLLRLHGSGAGQVNDRLAPLNINWLVSVDDSIAPGELGRATPPPGSLPPASPGGPAPAQKAPRPMTASEAFFHYPGPGADKLGYAQWLQSHPLHRMFRQVYPLHDAVGSLGQPIETAMHHVLKGGIREPLNFYHTLMSIVEAPGSEDRSKEFEILYRNAAAVSRNANGLLREQADFFSRFFSLLVALTIEPVSESKERLVESLRQEWLETDFNALCGQVETPAPQAHWQDTRPSRMKITGRRTLSEAIGHGKMSPRKRQKTDHHQDGSTAASNAPPALAQQAPDSPRQASPRKADTENDAELSPPLEGDRSLADVRSLTRKPAALKRKPGLNGASFKAWLESIPAMQPGASPATARASSARQASGAPASASAMMAADSHEKQLTNQ